MNQMLVAALAASTVALSACASSGHPPSRPPAKVFKAPITDPAANKALAKLQSQRLVGLMPLPPGSTLFTGTPPEALNGPAMGTPGTDQLIDTATYWSVPASSSSVLAWAAAHKPTGFTDDTTATGTDAEGTSFTAPKDPDAPDNDPGTLAVSAAPATSSTSLWRIDGMVVWYDPTPIKAPSGADAIHVTIADGCPSRAKFGPGFVFEISNSGAGLDDALLPAGDPSEALVCQYAGSNPDIDQPTTHRLLDAAQATDLGDQVRNLHIGTTGGFYSCPLDDGQADLIVFAMPAGEVDIMWHVSGCHGVSNGHVESSMGSLTLPK